MATLGPELADPRLAATDEEFAAARPGARAAIERAKDREFHGLDLVLNYTYASSPIIAAGAGERLPHAWLGPGDSLYDHLGPEFTLIRSGTRDDALVKDDTLVKAAAALGLPLTVLDLDLDALGGELVLVRPDQHVSWRGSVTDVAGDPEAIIRRAVSPDS
jgi:hypothetical protein